MFFGLDARIKKIEEYYSNLDNLEDDEQPYAETLKQEEIKRVMSSYGRKKKKVRNLSFQVAWNILKKLTAASLTRSSKISKKIG